MEESITVYSSATCPKCKMLKLELQKHGFKFEDCQDVERMSALGIENIPMMSVNNTLYGFKEAITWLKERSN